MAGNTAYKLGIVISTDASGVKPGAAEARNELASIGTAAEVTETKMQRLIATATGLHVGAANSNQREWAGALASEGLALDNLRAKYNPMFAVIRQYKAAQTEIRTAHAMGAISADEMTAALQRQRQAALSSIDAIKGRNSVLQSANRHNYAATNAMFQLQDIGVTAAMGMNPGMIALQQGTQLAGNFAGMNMKQVGSTMVGAFTQLLSPVALATVAVTGLSAAAIQYFMTSKKEAETASKAIEDHDNLIRRLRGAYGEAALGAREYSEESKKILGQDTADQIKSYRTVLAEAATSLLGGMNDLTPADFGGKTYLIGQAQSAMALLKQTAAEGSPDIQGFVEKLIEIENHPAIPDALKKTTQELREQAKESLTTQRALEQLLGTQKSLAAQRGVLIGSQAERDRFNYLDEESRTIIEMQRDAEARRAALNARSPQEKAAAARLQAATNREGSGEVFNLRVELAGREALAAAEKQLADAQRDRMRALQESVAGQQLELSLIGKTITEAEALRMEFQLTSQLKAEAAQNGVDIDKKELQAIKEKAQAYGQLAEKIAATKIIREQQDEAIQLRLEFSLVRANEAARQRAIAALAAEQELKRRGISIASDLGEAYRDNASRLVEMRLELDRQTDAWSRYRSAGESAIDTIFDGLSSGKFDFASIGKDLLSELTKTWLELDVKNPLKNALFGTNYGTMTDLLGSGKDSGGLLSSIIGQNISSMTVTAATVMVNGGVTGGIGGLFGLGAGTAANNNTLTGDIASMAKVIRSMESSNNYSALGPILASGDRAYGAYQVMGANVPSWTKSALGYSMTPGEFLKSESAQDAVFNKVFGGYVNKFGASGAAQAWFGGPGSVGSGGNAADILGTTGTEYVNKFNAGLQQLSATTGSATGAIGNLGSGLNAASTGLNQLGNGFNNFGQQLSGFASGGGFNIGSLFPGAGGFQSQQLAGAIASGSWGLWDTGGYTGPGGVYEPRGIVHAGEVVWSQRDVARAGGVAVVEGMRLGYRGYDGGGVVGVTPLPPVAQAAANSNRYGNIRSGEPRSANFHFHLDGARGDREIEDAAYRGMQTALREYNDSLPDRIAEINQKPEWR
ncbi:phage tail length tape measure family protein [Brucella intermedia]|uniref:phage tail length tape measure family protein n=1 Tax=Brucella intermedia TaxID=94625 RepID=UPI003AB51B30